MKMMKRSLTIALWKTIGRAMLVAVTFGTMGRKSFNYHAVSQK